MNSRRFGCPCCGVLHNRDLDDAVYQDKSVIWISVCDSCQESEEEESYELDKSSQV